MTGQGDPVRRWDALTSPEAAERASEDPVVVIPLAATEQHGPHLPLSTDADIARGILAAAFGELAADFPAFALPLQSVGASDEHAAFPGTVGTSARVLEEIVCSLGASVARHGVRRVVLFNAHGGNRAVMETAGLALRRARGVLVVKASWVDFPRPEEVDLPAAEWVHGLHGGAVETAMMLHLRPELVRTDAVRRFPSLGEELEESMELVGPEGRASFAWTAGDLHPEGVVGDATLATAEMGAALVVHYGRCLATVLREARAFPLGRLAAGGRGPSE